MAKCVKCGKETNDIMTTAYGEQRCEFCYDDYLMTDKGKVEYLIGIVRGDYPVDYFDADFLGHVAVCWRKYRLDLAYDLRSWVELKAKQLGIL